MLGNTRCEARRRGIVAVKIPFYQRAFLWVFYLLVGFLAVGSFLDAVSNAVSLVGPALTYVGSLIVSVLWVSAEFFLKTRPVRWVVSGGQEIRLRSLGIKPRLALAGAILLLWIPRVVDPAPGSERTTSRLELAKATSVVAEQIKMDRLILLAKKDLISNGLVKWVRNETYHPNFPADLPEKQVSGPYFDREVSAGISIIAGQIPVLGRQDAEIAKEAQKYVEELRNLHALEVVLKSAFDIYGQRLDFYEKLLGTPEIYGKLLDDPDTGDRLRLSKENVEKIRLLMGRGPIVEHKVVSILREKISSILPKGDSLLKESFSKG